MAAITCLVARGGHVEEIPVERLGEALDDPQARVWVDLDSAGEEGFERLLPALRFHPLVVEDCVVDVNRPKVDDYREYVYLAVHSARWEPDAPNPLLRELDMIVGPTYLVTYHEGETRSVQRAREVLARRADLLERGPDYLVHFLLDVMVDNYLPIVDSLQDRLDDVESKLFRAPTQRLLAEILRLKRGIARLRRMVGPQRDMILALTRDEFSTIHAELRPYLRDVYDRLSRVTDQLDSYRDELTAMLEIYSSQLSNRLNEVMKVLTVITVVLMPMNLVAGVYGMNFVFPEQRWPMFFGYFWALGLMVVVGIAMYLFIRSRRWL